MPPRFGLAAVIAAAISLSCQLDELTRDPPFVNRLAVSLRELRDSLAIGARTARQAGIAVISQSGAPLAWSARLSGSSRWIVLLDSGGTTPDTIGLRMASANLAVGVHHDTVVVSTSAASREPVRIPVSLTVTACPVQTFSIGTRVTGTITPDDCAAPHRSGSAAEVLQFDLPAPDSISIVLLAQGFTPHLILSTAPSAGTVTAQTSQCSRLAGAACLRYQALSRPGSWTIEAAAANADGTGSYTLMVTRPAPPGPPATLRQLEKSGNREIGVGGTATERSLRLGATISDPDTLETVRLDLEVRRVNQSFTGTATHSSGLASRGAIVVSVDGLSDATSYHWRARTRDETGRASAWVSFGSNAETAPDFRVELPNDAPASQPAP